MKKLITIVFAFVSALANAQFNFQHLYGGVNHERGQTPLETSNNKFLLNGVTTSYGQGGAEAIFVKNDNQGQIIWTKSYGTIDHDNSEYAIETNDLGYIGLGVTTVPIGSGSTDAWIFKTDSAGVLQWSKAYGNPGANEGFTHAIKTFDNGYSFIGYTRSIGAGQADAFLVHTDSNGDTIFTRSYGAIEIESGISLIQTADSGYAICGRQQTFPNGSAQSDGLIIRTDKNGDMLWANLYGDTLWEELWSIRELSNGNLAICGSTVSFGQGNYDILLLLTDNAGTPLNAFAYGGVNADASYDLHVNSDHSFVISGYTESFGYGHSFMGSDSTNVFLLKTDSAGQFLWMNTYGDGLQDEAFRSAQTSDGGYMISGYTNAYTPVDSTQMLLIKTDSLGFSGCHEESVVPVTATHAMPFVSAGFTQSSGVGVTIINAIETSITTVNNDACLYSNINSLEENDVLNIYPIPFSSELNIDLSNFEKKDCQVKIVNANGQIVFSESHFTGEKIITSNFAAGVYIVYISSGDQFMTKKAVKTF